MEPEAEQEFADTEHPGKYSDRGDREINGCPPQGTPLHLNPGQLGDAPLAAAFAKRELGLDGPAGARGRQRCADGPLASFERDFHRAFGAERLRAAHCYEFFAGTESFAALQAEEPGTFYLTPGWVACGGDPLSYAVNLYAPRIGLQEAYDFIRDDPRFQAMLVEVGLTD